MMMKTLNEVRWGIIGCGNVTEVKSGPAFQKIDNSTLVAVMRRNGELAKDYASRHQVPKWYDNADDLINDPEVNAVYVATPPSSHKENTLKAVAAGKPVYVEKPMALNYRECKDMIESCEQADVPLYVAYYRRALPRFKKIKEIIESGVLGDIRFVASKYYSPNTIEKDQENLPWRLQPKIAGGGLFYDLASHALDIQDFLLGPISEVKGIASNQLGLYEAEDIVTTAYRFKSGIHGMGTWCFSAFKHEDVTEIVGSKGKLEFSIFGSGDPITLTTDTSTETWSIENPIHVQQPLIQTIVDELTGKNGACPSIGKTAARTSWVMDGACHHPNFVE